MSDVISFSIITKNQGILTKEFSLTKDGKLEKDSSKCKLTEGSVKRIDAPFKDVGGILDGLALNQAITLGVPGVSQGEIVSSKIHGSRSDAITRTKDQFRFTNRFMIYFDYDPPPDKPPLTKEGLITKLRTLHPGLQDAAMLWRPSSSSFIYSGDQELTGLTGQHVYVPCRNPEGLEPFISTLKCECWFRELGWIMISAAGTALERVLFDTAVFSPERLVFEAGAQLESGLTQRLPESEYYPGKVLDLKKAELLNPSFIPAVKTLIAKKKSELSDDIAKVRRSYIQKQASALADSSGIDTLTARKIVNGRYEGYLLSKDILQADDDTIVSVKDILINPQDFVGMSFRDPLEPEYGKSKAKIFVNEDGSVICNSFAHGGRTFRLKHDDETFDEWLKNATETEIENNWVRMVASAADSAVAEAKLLEKLRLALGVSVTVLRKDLTTFKKAEAATMEQKNKAGDNGYLAGLVPPDDDADLTHDQIAELYIKQLPKDVVGAEGAVYQYNGKCIWEGLDLNTVQQGMIAKFDGVARCSRKQDYKAIAVHIYDKLKDERFFVDHQPCFATPSACYVVNGKDIDEAPHDSKYKIRHMFKFDADPKCDISMFTSFLGWAFQNDPSQIPLMQEIFGAILFGILNYQYHKAVLFKGPGANGKGVMFNIIRHIVPEDYVCVISPFDMREGSYRASLAGKLINLVPELPANRKIPGEIFKQIVDSSLVSARRLYEAPFSFVPICSQIFSSNYFIDSDDASEGMLRRWLFLGFDSVISEKDRISDYGRIIADNEGPGILNWALEGAARLLDNNGFTHTLSHTRLMDQWQSRINPVVGFISDGDYVMHVANNLVNRDALYNAYAAWCDKTHNFAMQKQTFVENMDKRYSISQHKGEWCYEGLKLIGHI
jgi:P4 family phage/plasmid primase-like protien